MCKRDELHDDVGEAGTRTFAALKGAAGVQFVEGGTAAVQAVR